MAAITAAMTYPKDYRYNRSLSLLISLVAARGEFDPKASNRVDQKTAPVTLPPLTGPDRPGGEGRKAGTVKSYYVAENRAL